MIRQVENRSPIDRGVAVRELPAGGVVARAITTTRYEPMVRPPGGNPRKGRFGTSASSALDAPIDPADNQVTQTF
jgi:hypothetical protein